MKRVDTVIKNAKVFCSGISFEGGVAIDEGIIVALGKEQHLPPADKVIDAEGKVLIPGAIDGHVHIREPWESEDKAIFNSASDIVTDTQAAAIGGVTMIINQPNLRPPIVNLEALHLETEVWKGKSYVDYGFHGGFMPKTTIKEIQELWREGVLALKTFMTTSGPYWPPISDGELLYALSGMAQIDALPIIHAENHSILEKNRKLLQKEGRRDYASHVEWRTPLAEIEAVKRVVFLLKESGSRGLIAHVSLPEAALEILKAKREGYKVYAETGPQYLFLTDEDLKKKGPWCKFAPPVRSRDEVAKLWELVRCGYMDVLGSDHAPYTKEQKEAGIEDIWKAPNGVPGVETSLPLMLSAVKDRKLSLECLIKMFCENPAKIYRVYPRKGTIAVGSDADLVIVDFNLKMKVTPESLTMKCGWSPYEGFELKALPVLTMVRGEIVMKDREIVGKAGYGKRIKRVSEGSI